VSGSCSAAMGTELMKPFFVHFGAAVPTGTASPGRSRPSGVLGTVRVTATTSARSLLSAVLVVALVGGICALLSVGDGLGAGRLVLDHLDRDQGQLATVVDLTDLDLDLLADADDVVEVLDPLTTVQLTDL